MKQHETRYITNSTGVGNTGLGVRNCIKCGQPAGYYSFPSLGGLIHFKCSKEEFVPRKPLAIREAPLDAR